MSSRVREVLLPILDAPSAWKRPIMDEDSYCLVLVSMARNAARLFPFTMGLETLVPDLWFFR